LEQKNEPPSRNAKKDEMILPPDAATPKCNDDVYLELSLHYSLGTHTSWWIYKHSVSLFGMMIQAANSHMSPPEKNKNAPSQELNPITPSIQCSQPRIYQITTLLH